MTHPQRDEGWSQSRAGTGLHLRAHFCAAPRPEEMKGEVPSRCDANSDEVGERRWDASDGGEEMEGPEVDRHAAERNSVIAREALGADRSGAAVSERPVGVEEVIAAQRHLNGHGSGQKIVQLQCVAQNPEQDHVESNADQPNHGKLREPLDKHPRLAQLPPSWRDSIWRPMARTREQHGKTCPKPEIGCGAKRGAAR